MNEIGKDDAALVFNENGVELMLPKSMKGKDSVPIYCVIAAALFWATEARPELIESLVGGFYAEVKDIKKNAEEESAKIAS